MITLALLWITWCCLHSLLITTSVNNWFKKKGGPYLGLYRLGYILFSILSFVPVLYYQYTLPQQLLFSWEGYRRLIQFVLLLYAVILFWYGKKNYDMNFFLGLTQWRDYQAGKAQQQLPFRCSGILLYVRHPWYSGGIALLWAMGPITDAGLLGKSILTLYLIIGALLEEQKLQNELGTVYRHYCRQVPMLIPWKGRVVLQQDEAREGSA